MVESETVNAHLTVRKYGRLTCEIKDYKIIALEWKVFCFVSSQRRG
jgi:hypothetical protein